LKDCYGSAKIHRRMRQSRLGHRSSIQGAARAAKRERSFKLSLLTLVRGIDAYGNPFQEQTELVSISSQEAMFTLNSGVIIGSRLQLLLEVPKTLILENQLRMLISGRVSYVRAEQNKGKKQMIVLDLDKNYRINSPPR